MSFSDLLPQWLKDLIAKLLPIDQTTVEITDVSVEVDSSTNPQEVTIGPDKEVKVILKGTPNRRARFEITNGNGGLPSVAMDSDPADPETYRGSYTIQSSDPSGTYLITCLLHSVWGSEEMTAATQLTIDTECSLVVTQWPDKFTKANSGQIAGTTDQDATVSATFTRSGDPTRRPFRNPPHQFPIPYSGLPDGEYEVEVSAWDPHRNRSTVTHAFSLSTSIDLNVTWPGSPTKNKRPNLVVDTDTAAQVGNDIRFTDVIVEIFELPSLQVTVVTANAQADSSGNFTFAYPAGSADLADGEYEIEVTATDPHGNTAIKKISEHLTTPGSENPKYLEIDSEIEPFTVQCPDPVVKEATDTITGSVEPGARVEVLIEQLNSTGSPISPSHPGVALVTMDQAGNFSFDHNLADGDYRITVTAIEELAGGQSNVREKSCDFTVDTTPPGNLSASYTQESPWNADTQSVELSATCDTDADSVEFVFTDNSGQEHTIPLNGSSGHFSKTLVPAYFPPDGEYEVKAVAKDPVGNRSEAPLDEVLIDRIPPDKPTIIPPIDPNPAAQSVVVKGTRPHVPESGAVDPTAIRIFFDGVFQHEIPLSDDPDFESPHLTLESLGDQEKEIEVRAEARDAGRNKSGRSDPVYFKYDPVAPVIEQFAPVDSPPFVVGQNLEVKLEQNPASPGTEASMVINHDTASPISMSASGVNVYTGSFPLVNTGPFFVQGTLTDDAGLHASANFTVGGSGFPIELPPGGADQLSVIFDDPNVNAIKWPSLAIDSDGNPHVVFIVQAQPNGPWRLKYVKWDTSGWVDPITGDAVVPADIETAYDIPETVSDFPPCLAVGSDGYARITFRQEPEGKLVFYRFQATAPPEFDDSIGGVNLDYPINELILDPSNHPHVCFSVGQHLRYATKNRGQSAFEPYVDVSSNNRYFLSASMKMDSTGVLHFAGLRYDSPGKYLSYVKSLDPATSGNGLVSPGQFTIVEEWNTLPNYGPVAIAIDPADQPHLIALETDSGDHKLIHRYLTTQSGSWQKEPLDTDPDATFDEDHQPEPSAGSQGHKLHVSYRMYGERVGTAPNFTYLGECLRLASSAGDPVGSPNFQGAYEHIDVDPPDDPTPSNHFEVGRHSSLAVDPVSGVVMICYLADREDDNEKNGLLKFCRVVPA